MSSFMRSPLTPRFRFRKSVRDARLRCISHHMFSHKAPFFQMWIFKVYIQCNCTLTQSCAAVKNVEIIECLKNNKVIKKIFSDASEIVFKVSNCEINWT